MMQFLKMFFLLFLIAEFLKRVVLFSRGRGFFRPKRFISPWFTAYDAPVPHERNGLLCFKRGQIARKLTDKNTIRIICLGDSTTINVPTVNHYPKLLQDKLNNFYKNVRFEVLNAGADAFTTAHSLVNLALKLRYFSPDCIIVCHNITDLSSVYFLPSLETDYANKYMDNLFLAAECKTGIQRLLLPSRLLSSALMKWNEAMFERKAKSMDIGREDIKLGGEIFETNLKNIVKIAETDGIKVILGAQPGCFRKKTAKFSYIKEKDFREYNKAVQKVAAEQNAVFADCFSGLGQQPEYFVDLVHNTESGVEKVSEVYFETIKRIYSDVKK